MIMLLLVLLVMLFFQYLWDDEYSQINVHRLQEILTSTTYVACHVDVYDI